MGMSGSGEEGVTPHVRYSAAIHIQCHHVLIVIFLCPNHHQITECHHTIIWCSDRTKEGLEFVPVKI